MEKLQHTLADIAKIRATGTFTGLEVTIEIHPSEPDSGIVFELISGDEKFEIPVRSENIIEAENRSVLGDKSNKNVQINITEHLLSALWGLGVDNARILVDAPEIPLIDGSALKFMEAIDVAGIISLDKPVKEIIIDSPLVIDDGNIVLMVVPHDKFTVTHYLDHENPLIGKRSISIDITPENYRERIGPARTFLLADNVPSMVKSGEVKNTDLSQAIIVYEDHLSQPLRFDDEFSCHKVLDIVGDLALIGRRIRGHVIGIRSGHKQNRAMARKVAARYL